MKCSICCKEDSIPRPMRHKTRVYRYATKCYMIFCGKYNIYIYIHTHKYFNANSYLGEKLILGRPWLAPPLVSFADCGNRCLFKFRYAINTI